MLPSDEFATEPFRANVRPTAGGHLLAITYQWKHPEDDDPYEGLILLGCDGEGGLTALWGDAWHQQPSPLAMTGSVEPDGSLLVAAPYSGEWEWRIALALDGVLLRMRMDNVVPVSQATGEISAGSLSGHDRRAPARLTSGVAPSGRIRYDRS